MLDAAIAYAKHGWHVFPCHEVREGRCSCGDLGCNSPGKHPRTENGLKNATRDPDTIRDRATPRIRVDCRPWKLLWTQWTTPDWSGGKRRWQP